MAVRHVRTKAKVAKGQPFKRRLRSGKVIVVRGRKVSALSAAPKVAPALKRRRKQRQSNFKAKGRQLAAGLKFNSRGQIVSDPNARRVATRARKQKASKKTSVVRRKKQRRKKR